MASRALLPLHLLRSFALCCLGFLWTGCSTFTHYPDQMEHSLQTFEAGRLEEASQSLEKKTKGGLDQLVYTLEDAMVSHTEGKLAESNKGFSDAEALIRNQEKKAVISASQTAAEGASILLNEKTIPYGGEPFEKVLVNTYKALNYLLLGEFEDARVEVRRSFARQKENRERHAKELQEMEDQARRKRIRSQEYYREISSRYGDQVAIGQRVANLYEDPFAYYLSALVYELNGEYNDSYVDLKRVQTLYPGIPCVEDDLLRAAKRSGMADEVRRWEKTLGRKVREPKSTEGELILIFECGMAPRKTEIKIPLFIPNVGVIAMAFPKYEVLPNRVDHAALFTQEGFLLGRTYTFTDLEAIAIKNLEDRMPILILKQVLRAAAKATVTKVVSDQNGAAGVAGAVLSNIYNVVSEQADLRCWLTLPRDLQATRIALPSGRHDLVLSLEAQGGMSTERKGFSVEIKPGHLVFVDARSSMTNLIALHVF